MKRNHFVILTLLAFNISIFSQDKKIDALLKDFQSTNWPMVLKAKESLENTDAACIPYLMKLIKNNSTKKLVNTGDLIYPGAEKFFGHGQIIDYDIDKIEIRAGWLLEDLTFQDFGFSGVHIEATALTDYIKVNFAQYYNANKVKVDNATEKEKRDIIKNLSIEKAEKWWEIEGSTWSRYDALIISLNSNDEKRQVKGLFYLRNGKSECPGLTRESFKEKIEPLVAELAKSGLKRVSEQAKLILVDTDFEWLGLKPTKN